MKHLIFLSVLFFLISSQNLFSQDFTITNIQKNTMQNQAASLIRNYETGLNNLGDSLSPVNEKEYFVTDIILSIFAGDDVLIFNDLDPDELEPDDLKADVYLNNIITKYSKGANFSFKKIAISDPFYLDSTNAFIKVELERHLKGYHLDEWVNNTRELDIYISFDRLTEGNFRPPSIYSISDHIENLSQFKKVKTEQEVEVLNLSVLSPNENTEYKRGKNYQLVWRGSSNDKPVKLELYKSGKKKKVITERILGRGYNWAIPINTETGDDYQIKLTNYNNPDNAVLSKRFTIKRKIPLLLKIVPVAAIATAGILVFSDSGDSGPETLPGPPGPN